jgi:TP901-1 family phage major tail protein
MAVQKGKLVVLKDGLVTVAGARETGMSINGEMVDVTSKDSNGQREALAGSGITSMSISISGVFSNSTEQLALASRALDNSVNAYTIVDESGSDYTGDWMITSYSTSGAYNGEQTFEATLESAGVIVYTAV